MPKVGIILIDLEGGPSVAYDPNGDVTRRVYRSRRRFADCARNDSRRIPKAWDEAYA
jgi:hypothetical protein